MSDDHETDMTTEMQEERELRGIRRCQDLDWEQGIWPAEDNE
jgi:hypothetical protein